MIYNNDLLKTKVVPIDTENRKKFILPSRYSKVTDSASFLEALSNCEHNNEKKNFIIIDSIDFPVKR